ncbi:uncharacterized protein Hap1MRO34_009779 [Clarias gariepinus]
MLLGVTRGADKIIFGKGIKLLVKVENKEKPKYYKVTEQNGDKEYCLATGFTVQNATLETQGEAGAVRFEGEGYYSRLMPNDTKKCEEAGIDQACKSESGDSSWTFNSDPKTRFLSLSIFWLRVLFLKTIVFNVLMTLKVWMT